MTISWHTLFHSGLGSLQLCWVVNLSSLKRVPSGSIMGSPLRGSSKEEYASPCAAGRS